MKKNLTLIKYAIILSIILFITSLYCCNYPNRLAIRPDQPNQNMKPENIKRELIFNYQDADSIRIIFTDDENITRFLSREDAIKLSQLSRQSQYDTLWNRGDIMIKMIAPDYTLFIKYKEEERREDDIYMLWRNDRRIKYKNIWYTLNISAIEEIIAILEKYRN